MKLLDARSITRLLLAAAGWCCVIAIITLSLVPQAERVGTGMSGKYEHFLAYSVTSALLVLSTGGRRRLLVPVCLALLAFLLEALQSLTPDRHPRLSDALVGAFAAALGAAIVALFTSQARIVGMNQD